MNNPEIPIYSLNDILTTTNKYLSDNSCEIQDTILYFVSEMTGLSIDTLVKKMNHL